MPKMSDWKDYIPVRGEAEAQLRLKGAYGGKNMQRRFNRRSRFRGRRSQRYWIPFFSQAADGAGSFLQYEEPRLIVQITPGGNVDPEVLQTTMAQQLTWQTQQARLLMTQGSIPLVARLTGNLEDWLGGDYSRMIPFVRMFYWWVKVRETASGFLPDPFFQDTATSQYVWSASPNTQFGALQDMMNRKDVLSWGFRNIQPINPFNARLAYNGTTAEFYNARVDPYFQVPKQQFVPMPRMPRKGFSFGPGESLRCYAVLTDPFFGGQTVAGTTDTGIRIPIAGDLSTRGLLVSYFPMFRALFAK